MTSAHEHGPHAGDHGPHAPRPLYAVVGATDLAVERAKEAIGDVKALPGRVETGATRLGEEIRARAGQMSSRSACQRRLHRLERPQIDPEELQQRARRAQARAATATIQAASRTGQEYERLAERGKEVMDRLKEQPATQSFLTQGKETWDRTRHAVETARRALDEKAGEALGVIATRRSAHGHADHDAPVRTVRADRAAGEPEAAEHGPVGSGPVEPGPQATGARSTVTQADAGSAPSTGKTASTRKVRPSAGPRKGRPAGTPRARKAPGPRSPRTTSAEEAASGPGVENSGTPTPRARKRTEPPASKPRSNRKAVQPEDDGSAPET